MSLRQELRDSFQADITRNISGMRRHGLKWQTIINDKFLFEVSLDFSDPKFIPNTVTVRCQVYAKDVTDFTIKNDSKMRWETVRFPYSIHHQLFEMPGAMWSKKKVGYLYWILLMQQKKIHINSSEQIKYTKDVLFPFAAKEVQRIYYQYNKNSKK